MIDLSKHIQEGARLELEALERSTDECSFLSAQNSYQEMKIDELKRELAAANEKLQECMAHADAMAEWEWAHPYSEKFAAYREWRAKQ